MKAIKYKIKVCEGTMDWVHGGGHTIDEIAVPELGLVINSESVFLGIRQDGPIDLVEIEIQEEITDKLVALATMLSDKNFLETSIKEHFGFGKNEKEEMVR